MFVLLDPDGEHVPDVGFAIQILGEPDLDFYRNGTVIWGNNEYPHEVQVEICELTDQLQHAMWSEPYYERIPEFTHLFTREMIFMCPSQKAVITLVAISEEPIEKCTMREVFAGHILVRDPERHWKNLKGMALELHILQHIKHNNIVTLLSIDRNERYDQKYVVFYESSVPLLYYVKEYAFRDRPNAANVFESENTAIYILRCVAAALERLAADHITYGGKIHVEAIYIAYNGVAKLGCFLNTKIKHSICAYRKNLAAVAGIFLALLNRKMPPAELEAFAANNPPIQNAFVLAYHNTSAAFPYCNGYEHNAISAVSRTYIRRCLQGVDNYTNIVNSLGLNNILPFNSILYTLTVACARFFNSEPYILPDDLPPVDEVRRLEGWSHLEVLVTIQLDDEPDQSFTLNLPDARIESTFLDIVNRLVENPPNGLEGGNIDDPMNALAQDPGPFRPADILSVHTALVFVYNQLIDAANFDGALDAGMIDEQDHERFIGQQNTRLLRLRMEAINGVRN